MILTISQPKSLWGSFWYFFSPTISRKSMFVVLPLVKRAPTSYALLNAFQSLTYSKMELHLSPSPFISTTSQFLSLPLRATPSLAPHLLNKQPQLLHAQPILQQLHSLLGRGTGHFSNSEVAKPWLASSWWGKTRPVSHKPQSGLPSCLPEVVISWQLASPVHCRSEWTKNNKEPGSCAVNTPQHFLSLFENSEMQRDSSPGQKGKLGRKQKPGTARCCS